MRTTDTIEEFMERIHLPVGAVDEVLRFQMTEEELAEWEKRFQNDRDDFFSQLELREDQKLRTLYLYIRFALKMKPVFLENNISEKIYYDTFHDLTIWCKWCKKYYGIYGMVEARWYERLYEMKVFRLGRLEFEKIILEEDIRYSGGHVKKGEKVIGVHIPEGGSLLPEACDESFALAEKFFSDEYKLYTCSSWLTSPALYELLDETSNILKFQKRFEILDIQYMFPLAEQRVYGIIKEDKNEYPEDTRLQKNLKKFLLEGKKVGIALGVMKRSN
ncbi:acyltransferase domain-containing protein [Bariatricus sp. SGI.161]|uniref:acyltransferase domain-containing protein n=1 Tax=Lachnospiraceae TaxID=186803 RepID=UPI002A79FA36|nr:acyltransferase domain-containing protein [Lachnospiraceae bacterium]MCI6533482.1 acyltransferase domain-containing protein [Lachnospiraceae bacterium]MDY2614438.1 acyltransferase domain-containing protein [Lachnospiraceae bacterium]MDY4206340.1 acyltransferase domain-containing protein [Lachnospiraceae bacterium]